MEGHGQPMSFLDVAVNYGIFPSTTRAAASAPAPTCHLHVKQGAEGNQRERGPGAGTGWRRRRASSLNSRLGCQAVIERAGTYVVEIPKWKPELLCRKGKAGAWTGELVMKFQSVVHSSRAGRAD